MNYIKDELNTAINFDIKTYEIDIAGHVNNIVYVKWLEDLRIKIFEKFFPVDKLLKEDLYPAVISTHIYYKKQLKITDKPTGYVEIENITHNIITLKFEFISDNKICVIAEQKCILMNIKNATMDKAHLKNLVVLK